MVKTLTDVDKHAIENMVRKNMSIGDIKGVLGRSKSSRVVENYVRDLPQEEVMDQNEKDWDDAVSEVTGRLEESGLKADKIRNLIRKAFTKINKNETAPDSDLLFVTCIKSIGSGELMKTTTNSGEEGVTIMTPGAAQRATPPSDGRSRHLENNVFKPKG